MTLPTYRIVSYANFVFGSGAVILLFLIMFIPLAFSEVTENSITLSSHEIKKPEYSTGFEQLTITGNIQGYERGDSIHLFILSPSGDIKKFNAVGTKDGDYFIAIYIDSQFELGEYNMTLAYKNTQISSEVFSVI